MLAVVEGVVLLVLLRGPRASGARTLAVSSTCFNSPSVMRIASAFFAWCCLSCAVCVENPALAFGFPEAFSKPPRPAFGCVVGVVVWSGAVGSFLQQHTSAWFIYRQDKPRGAGRTGAAKEEKTAHLCLWAAWLRGVRLFTTLQFQVQRGSMLIKHNRGGPVRFGHQRLQNYGGEAKQRPAPTAAAGAGLPMVKPKKAASRACPGGSNTPAWRMDRWIQPQG